MMIWCAWFSVCSSSAMPNRFWKAPQTAALREPVVDLDDTVCGQLRHPRRIVQRLGDDLARCAVALELDEHQAAVGRDGQQIDAPAVAGDPSVCPKVYAQSTSGLRKPATSPSAPVAMSMP